MNDREYVLCALSVATRAIENAATALHKQEAREFEDTAQTKGSPKLPSNSAWKLVPVEPTEQMLDAMQESALVSFDAAIEAELSDGPAVESLHRVVYRAMLAAAPEAPDHREAMRQALEYVSWHAHGECRVGTGPVPAPSDVVASLRAALGERDE